MKYVFTLLIFLAAATSGRLHAQIKKKTPNGYPTLYDYRTNNPDGSRIYYADKRSAALMKVSPGNDYKIECNEAMDKDYLTDSLWGIVYKDTVYLNCKPFSGLDWYAKAEYGTGKRYLYLNIAIPLNPKYKSILGDYSQAPAVKTGGSIPKIGGLIGGAVKGAVDRLSTRIPVIYDTETGQCRCLTTELLYSFSQKYPELKSQFGLVKIEMLSVYAFRDFAEALNTADEQEKLKAKQAEQQAAEAEAKARAEAERAAADSVAQAAAAPAVDSTNRSDKGETVSPTETPAGSGTGPGYDGRSEQGAGQDSGTSPGPVIRESSFPLKGVGQRTAPVRMQVRRVRSGNDKGFFPKRFPQSLSAAVRQMLGAQPTGTNSRPERHSSRLRRIPGDRTVPATDTVTATRHRDRERKPVTRSATGSS